MGQIVISGLDPQVMTGLGLRAASHGRSVEGEARQILTDAVAKPGPHDWKNVDAIRQRLTAKNGALRDSVELLREDRDR